MTGSGSVGVPSAEAAYVVAAWKQLVVAARGLRDCRAIREASARDRGGRTPTFAVRRPGAKLKTRAVYQRNDIVLSHGKPIPRDGNGEQA